MVDKLDPVWASDGTAGYVVAPADTTIERGWAPTEQPANSYENWRANRSESKINELVDSEASVHDYDVNDTIASRCSLLPSSDTLWHPQSANNTVTTNVAMICTGYDYENSRECVFGLYRTTPKYISVIYNDYGTSLVPQQTTITLNDISATDVSIDLCCDGSYLYIVTNNAAQTSSTFHKYLLTADGIVNPNRVAYYTVASKLFLDTSDDDEPGGRQICVANDNYLGFIDITGNRVGKINKTLSAAPSYGIGNLNYIIDNVDEQASYSIWARSIVSDGERLWAWYTVGYSAGDIATYKATVCAALLTDLSDATAGLTRSLLQSQCALEDHPDNLPGTLCWDGRNIHAISGWLNYDTGAHRVFDHIFDITSDPEAWMPYRYSIVSGFDRIPGGTGGSTIAACYTGARVAIVCPVATTTSVLAESHNFDNNANWNQKGLVFIPSNASGFNIPTDGSATYDQQITPLYDDKITVLDSNAASSYFSRVNAVVYSDDCIWIVVLKKDGPSKTNQLIRVVKASHRK